MSRPKYSDFKWEILRVATNQALDYVYAKDDPRRDYRRAVVYDMVEKLAEGNHIYYIGFVKVVPNESPNVGAIALTEEQFRAGFINDDLLLILDLYGKEKILENPNLKKVERPLEEQAAQN